MDLTSFKVHGRLFEAACLRHIAKAEALAEEKELSFPW